MTNLLEVLTLRLQSNLLGYDKDDKEALHKRLSLYLEQVEALQPTATESTYSSYIQWQYWVDAVNYLLSVPSSTTIDGLGVVVISDMKTRIDFMRAQARGHQNDYESATKTGIETVGTIFVHNEVTC